MLARADTLEPWRGEPLQVTIDTATVTFEDGRPPQELKVEPYAVTRKYPLNIGEMWTREDLLAVGLIRVILATPPAGKQFAPGEPTYARDGDVAREVRPIEDIPPPRETVTIEKTEHDKLVADAESWRTQGIAMAARLATIEENDNAAPVSRTEG
jgi:hypothetical protein